MQFAIQVTTGVIASAATFMLGLWFVTVINDPTCNDTAPGIAASSGIAAWTTGIAKVLAFCWLG